MTRMFKLLFLACLLANQVLAQSLADSSSEPDYSVFSLEELFRVDVITASKEKEPLWDAPGVVTVLTRQEIEKFGGNNLWDLLERLPAVQKNFSGGVQSTSIRGGEGLTQNHILILIDGRPFRTSNGNLSTYNATLTFPISMIERIEIVRGPGSALYGTNAFEGVFNIITRKAKEDIVEVSTRTGSFNTKGGDVYFHTQVGEVNINLGYHYFDTDGWSFKSNTNFQGSATNENGERVLFTKDVFEDNKGYQAKIDYKGFSISTFQGKANHFAEIFYNADDAFSWHSTAKLYSLTYETKLTDTLRIEVNANRNEEDFDWVLDGLDSAALPYRSRDNLFEFTLFGKLSNKLSFMLGGVYQHWKGYNPGGDFGAPIKYKQLKHNSAYGQITYRPNRFAKLIAGAQWNKAEDEKADLVPRTGGIFNFSPRLGMKLLYGQAFKSPIPQDKYINTPGFVLGNGSLVAEKITTYNLQVFYQGEKHLLVFTAFDSIEKDLLRLLPPTEEDFEDFKPYYPDMSLEQFLSYLIVNKNQGELRIKGGEIEAKYVPNENWYMLSAVSYQQNKDGDNIENTTLAPSYLVKVGLGYTSNQFSMGLFDINYSAFKDNRIVNPTSLQLNEPSSSYNVLTLNTNYTIQMEKWNLKFEAYGYNLLDQEAWVHELPGDSLNTIPGIAGRSIYVAAKAIF